MKPNDPSAASPFLLHQAQGSPWLALCAGLMLLAAPLQAQPTRENLPLPAPSAPAAEPARAELLRTPRHTLQTLYYSVMAFDFCPPLIDDAIACLELDVNQVREPAEAARLAIALENVLRELSVPVLAAPEAVAGDTAVIFEHESCKIALHRQPDGLWRFDQDTVSRIPAMYRTALARHRDLQAERNSLRDGYTDPSATMKRFLMDCIKGDFYAAAQALDLSGLSSDEREDRGPLLAQQLACVIQRRGWTYYQEIPNQPSGPAFTWHADRTGRIVLDRIRQPNGKDAWLFTRQTISNLPRMFEQARTREPDSHWTKLKVVVPLVGPEVSLSVLRQRPATVPAHLGSPRDVLQGFFRAMDAAEVNDRLLTEALDYLDLAAISPADRQVLGVKIAAKLEAILRRVTIDLVTVPDEWNASPQILGQNQNLRIEILRQRDGCWRFSQDTVAQVPNLFEKLPAQGLADRDRSNHLESARDTMTTFLTAINHHDLEQAATCLDLGEIHPAAQAEVGPVLAFKLKYVIDRIARVYVQAVPDEPTGARYVFYRGDLGRIVIARKPEGPRKGCWLFTVETVERIESMFRALQDAPVAETMHGIEDVVRPTLSEAPGIWLRSKLPAWTQMPMKQLGLYQWVGLVLAVLSGWAVSRLVLSRLYALAGWQLKRGGSTLTTRYICQKMRPLTWLAAWWLFFQLLAFLDLPMDLLHAIMPLKKFVLAGLMGWLGIQVTDLVTAICTNSELLRPHRNLSEMIVPVLVRTLKGVVVLLVVTYVVYQVGEGESLGRFLTGLGVVGLTASLAAQDTMKSFFGTLLLISERSFQLGDRIVVGSQEGVVEKVGFRSTRLRTPEGSLLTIPNATMAASGIDNRGARSFCPFHTTVFIGYDTSFQQLASFRERLQEWLLHHPGIDPDQVDVSIQRFSEHGIELSLNLQLVAANGNEEKQVRDEIHREVLRLAQSMGIGLAGAAKPAPEAVVEVQEPSRPVVRAA